MSEGTINGNEAVALAYQAIRCNDNNLIVAGGQESMTRAQHTAYIRGSKIGAVQFNDTLLCDGLTDVFNKVHMGKTAEYLANKYHVTREAQDQFALNSQLKANKAIEEDLFKKEITAIANKLTGKAIDKDEFPKPNTTIESLSKLKPAFDSNGTVTAGNSSGINDGAAAVVLCSSTHAKKKQLKPWAQIIAVAEVGLEPMCMGLGPIDAVNKVLSNAHWNKDEVDLFELNEAFAVQSIIVVEQLGLNPEKVNVTGGAIALGHPIGAAGARILVTLLHNLERLNKKKGVAALCVGGGMGIAIAVERLS